MRLLPDGLDGRGALTEAVVRDFAEHGRQAIARLREANPVAYARLIGEAVHFKALQPERTPRETTSHAGSRAQSA